MSDLKTNYTDDILDSDVNSKRKYRIINNADETISLEDVTVYLQNGDVFGAKDINETNEKVNLSIKSLNVKKIEIVPTVPDEIIDGTVYFTYE